MAYAFRSTTHSSGRRGLFFFSVLAVLIVLLNLALGGKISAALRDGVTPLSRFGGRFTSSLSSSGFFATQGQLEAQIAALQNEVQQESLQAAAFEAVQQENTSLSTLTHLAETSPGLAAPITSSIISSPYGTFSIGAGSADKVTQGSLVLTADGFVIGRIVQVQQHQSLVEEVFAPGEQTPVTIDGAAAVVSGQGGEAEAEVPHGVPVSQNDPVIAPGLENKPVGMVAHVDADPANAEQSVYVSLPVSLSSLEYVYVAL